MSAPHQQPGTVLVPASTPAPLYAAAGVTLMAASLVTHPLAGMVGFCFFAGGVIAWLRQLLPHEQEEARALEAPPAPVRPSPEAVQHKPDFPHRARLPVEVYPIWAGPLGGVAGGLAMAALALLYGIVRHGSPWYAVNLMAAVAMPELGTASHETLLAFDPTAVALATVVHGLVSLLVGLLYGAILPAMPWHPLLSGGLVAPVMWTALLAGTLHAINPALNARVDWTWFVASQIAFGLVAGAVVMRAEKVPTAQ